MPPKDPNPIVLFSGGDDGYGDAEAAGRNSYGWTYNMDARSPGRITPSVVPAPVGLRRSDIPREVGAAFEWETAAGVPFILVAGSDVEAGSVQRTVGKLEDGVFTNEDRQAGAGYTGGVLYRHDGSDADVEAAFFCNGEGEDEIERRKKDGTYTAGGANDAKADTLNVIGSDLWRTAGYMASKLTRDTSPGTDANYPVNVRAGRPTYPINTLLELGGAPLPLKGDGIFKYNAAPSQTTFGNEASFAPAHKDNGKGGFIDGRGRVYYFTVDGDAIVLTFGNKSQQRPTREMRFSRDTPFGRITTGVADGNYVYVAVEPGSVRTQGLGLEVRVYDATAGEYTDPTGALTDGKLSTTASFNIFGVQDDLIYLGADEPQAGWFWEIGTPNAGLTLPFQNAEYSKGSGNWGKVPVRDSTMGFTEDGCIAVLTE